MITEMVLISGGPLMCFRLVGRPVGIVGLLFDLVFDFAIARHPLR